MRDARTFEVNFGEWNLGSVVFISERWSVGSGKTREQIYEASIFLNDDDNVFDFGARVGIRTAAGFRRLKCECNRFAPGAVTTSTPLELPRERN